MKPRILFLDIETAPNKVFAWGLYDQDIHIDQIVDPGYTMCWAAKWRGERAVHFDSVHRSSRREMVKGIHALLDEADAVCHYNGTKFDIPLLNQEIALAGMMPPSPAKNIDLLSTARQFRFPSHKLDYVARAFGLGQKIRHKGMEMWRDCMDGDAAAWKVMERYNKQDVVLLERVYERLLPWIKGHPNMGLFVESDKPVCPHCGKGKPQARGYAYTATAKYQRYQCRGCGKWARGRQSVLDKGAKVLVAA